MRCAALILPLLTIPLALPAQEIIQQGRRLRTPISAGIQCVEFARSNQTGGEIGQWVQIDPGSGNARLDVVLPRNGPWSTEPLGTLVERAGGVAGFAVSLEPGISELPWPSGLLFTEGDLHAWPAGGPVLLITAEGKTGLLDPPPFDPAAITLDDGTALPLASINGAPSQDAAALYSGLFVGDSRAGNFWPDGTSALPIFPSEKNTDPGRSLWSEGLMPEQRQWITGRPAPMERLTLDAGEWALILPPDVAREHLTRLQSAEFVAIHAPLPEKIAFSLAAIQTGRWILRDGQIVADPSGEEPQLRAAIGIDNFTRRTAFFGFGTQERAAMGVTRARLANILLLEKLTDAVELPPGALRILPNVEDAKWDLSRTTLQSRLALAAVNEPAILELDGDRDFRRIRIGPISGSAPSSPHNHATALIDGIAEESPALDQFWASQIPEEAETALLLGESHNAAPRPWVEFRLEETRVVGALDLIHVENCGFSPRFNLRSYVLKGRNLSSEPWTDLARVEHDRPTPRDRIPLAPPVQLSQIRLEVITPNFFPEGKTARLAEITVWGELEQED